MAEKPGWGTALSLALVGVIGAWLGSAVQHFLSLQRERTTAFDERQSEAYSALLNALEKRSVARAEETAGNTEMAKVLDREFRLEAGTARSKIAVFGDKRVVEALANWYRSYEQGERPTCDEKLTAELALWQGMRNALLGDDQTVSLDDLAASTAPCRPAQGP
jgi:hypothetical protein